jgi:predicted GIY-YIG superfamily endonuclease
MPKLSMGYSRCCIYEMGHIDDDSLVYVGHTTNFKQRKQRHKSSCNNKNDLPKHSYKYIK